MRTWTSLVALALSAACHSEMPETEVVHGELVDYHYSPEFEICAGTAAAFDAAARRAAELLGLEVEGLQRVEYYWLTKADYQAIWDDSSPCATARGCAVGLRSAGLFPVLPHEIVHTVANQWDESAAPFLAEGFAEAVVNGRMEKDDPRPYMTLDVAKDGNVVGYWVASRFVRYLLQVHGTERFGALYRSVPRGSELSDWDKAVRASYGMSLDELVEEYLTASECPPELMAVRPLECDAPTLTADAGGNFSWTSSLYCDEPGVIGGLQPPGEPMLFGETHLELRRTFEIAEPGDYEIAVVTPEGEGTRGQARVTSCGNCAWSLDDTLVLEGAMTKTRWLAQGRYAVTLLGFVEAETVELHVTRLEGASDSTLREEPE